MSIPEWAQEVINHHQVFEDRGISVEVGYNPSQKRVEAICWDVPRFLPFPHGSWWVTESHFKQGIVIKNLQAQANHLEEYLNGN